MHTFFRTCGLIDVRNASGFALRADENFARHRTGKQSELARLHCGRDEHLAGTEIRSRGATSAALTAIMARRTAVERLGENGEARGNAGDIEFVAGLFDEEFVTARFRRGKKDAVGGAWHILPGSEHADIAFHLIV